MIQDLEQSLQTDSNQFQPPPNKLIRNKFIFATTTALIISLIVTISLAIVYHYKAIRQSDNKWKQSDNVIGLRQKINQATTITNMSDLNLHQFQIHYSDSGKQQNKLPVMILLDNNELTSLSDNIHNSLWHLSANNNSITKIFNNSFEGLQELNLNGNPIQSFTGNRFPLISQLDLSEMLLAVLASNQLDSLTNLLLPKTILNITSNSFKSLSSISLQNCNNLMEISNNVFDALKHLQINNPNLINLTSNRYNSLESLKIYSSSLPTLAVSDITLNSLQIRNSILLQHLTITNVKDLILDIDAPITHLAVSHTLITSLQNITLKSLESIILVNNSRLQSFNLDQYPQLTNITLVNSTMINFENAKDIIQLTLKNTNLSKFSNYEFLLMQKLQLCYNSALNSISNNVFTNLKTLKLSNFSLSNVQNNTFYLQELILTDSDLQLSLQLSLETIFESQSTLLSLSMVDVRLPQDSLNFLPYHHLQKLVVINTNISPYLLEQVANLPNISYLHIENLNLSYFNSFQTALATLVLIDSCSQIFLYSNMPNLVNLHLNLPNFSSFLTLDYPQLTSLQLHLPKVTQLFIARSKIKQLYQFDLPNIRSLRIYNSAFINVDNVLSLDTLSSCILINVSVAMIQATSRGLKNLTIISSPLVSLSLNPGLQNLRLTDVLMNSFEYYNLQKLQSLFISDLNLTSFSNNILPSLRTLTLDHTPLCLFTNNTLPGLLQLIAIHADCLQEFSVQIPSIKYLQLSATKLTVFDGRAYPNLQILTIEASKINRLVLTANQNISLLRVVGSLTEFTNYHLPNLNLLIIQTDRYINRFTNNTMSQTRNLSISIFKYNDSRAPSFPNLGFLRLVDCPSLVEIPISADLTRLQIQNAPILSIQSFKPFPALKQIQFVNTNASIHLIEDGLKVNHLFFKGCPIGDVDQLHSTANIPLLHLQDTLTHKISNNQLNMVSELQIVGNPVIEFANNTFGLMDALRIRSTQALTTFNSNKMDNLTRLNLHNVVMSNLIDLDYPNLRALTLQEVHNMTDLNWINPLLLELALLNTTFNGTLSNLSNLQTLAIDNCTLVEIKVVDQRLGYLQVKNTKTLTVFSNIVFNGTYLGLQNNSLTSFCNNTLMNLQKLYLDMNNFTDSFIDQLQTNTINPNIKVINVLHNQFVATDDVKQKLQAMFPNTIITI